MLSYIRFFIGSTVVVLLGIGVLNFTVDPANIYRGGSVTPQSYADALLDSENGLYDEEGTIDERLLAKAMARESQNVDCVIVGSSHVMQIGSMRGLNSMQDICHSILNLNAFGASIEDHFVLSYLTLQKSRGSRLKKIILGVDPWIFAFGKDQRWSTYKDDYLSARVLILGDGKSFGNSANAVNIDESVARKLSNLLNLEYTIRSVKVIFRTFRSGAPTITAAPKVNPLVGGEHPIRLKDNSYVYSAKHISDAVGAPVPLGGTTYATDGALNQPNAINAYRRLILWIKSQGVDPILLMTPYHENVLRATTSPNAIALRKTEPLVLNLAHELDVMTIGSYDPQMFGCSSKEFYDFMHPTSDCLAKLQVR